MIVRVSMPSPRSASAWSSACSTTAPQKDHEKGTTIPTFIGRGPYPGRARYGLGRRLFQPVEPFLQLANAGLRLGQLLLEPFPLGGVRVRLGLAAAWASAPCAWTQAWSPSVPSVACRTGRRRAAAQVRLLDVLGERPGLRRLRGFLVDRRGPGVCATRVTVAAEAAPRSSSAARASSVSSSTSRRWAVVASRSCAGSRPLTTPRCALRSSSPALTSAFVSCGLRRTAWLTAQAETEGFRKDLTSSAASFLPACGAPSRGRRAPS